MSRKESWSANQEGGFTLLEVIVVLTLILLLTGLVYPMGRTFNESILVRLSLAQLNNDLLELQAQALGGGDRPVLIFSPGAEDYLVQLGALSLKRPLAGLTIDTESEIKIDFSRFDPAGAGLILRSARGARYHFTFDDQGKPVIKPIN